MKKSANNYQSGLNETNKKIDSLSEKFDVFKETTVDKTTFAKFKDQIITLLDKVMGELKAIREEQTIMSSYKDQLEDHETRILTLEKD